MRRPAAAAALTLLLGACGSPGGGGDADARQAVLAAVSTTEDAGSARLSGEMSFSLPEVSDASGLSNISMTLEGVTDLDGRRAQMTMSFEGLPETPGGGGFDDIEMVVDGTDLYMKASVLTDTLGDDKPWLRMDVSDMVGSGAQFSQTDPTQSLRYLEGVSDDVEEVGREEIRGVNTTQYDATVDIARMMEELPEGARDQAEAAFDKLDVDEFPLSVWIDDQGRIRRMFSEFGLSGATEGAEGSTMTMTFDYYDFGVEFDIDLPPDDQVQDAPAGLFGTSTS
jgi:hypothetical protein